MSRTAEQHRAYAARRRRDNPDAAYKWMREHPGYSAEWYRKNPDARLRGRLRKYGLTVPEFKTMLQSQNSLCAICHKPDTQTRLAVDHNHITGKIRGLLCGICNRHLGILENTEFVEKATSYLRSYDAK